MNNMHDTESENKPLILAGIRDNLLKPMAEEICAKTEARLQALRKLVWWAIGISLFTAAAHIASVIIFMICK